MSASSTFVATDGDGYELTMGRWSRRLAGPFLAFAGTADGERVLDVGCGTGSLCVHLTQDPEIVVVRGLDLSAAYVAYGQRRNPDRRLTLEVGDACALPYPDAAFDHTLSMLALQFVPRAEVAVREMCRVTRPGGRVAAATWDTRGGFVALRMVLDAAALLVGTGPQARAAAYTRPLTRPDDLARLWSRAGLDHVEQAMLTIRMDFSSFADFWTPHTGGNGPVAAFVSTLSRHDANRLEEAVRLAYLDGEADGPRSYAATAWAVRGEVPLAS